MIRGLSGRSSRQICGRAVFSALGLSIAALWLYFGNLGCLEGLLISSLLRREIVFKPASVTIVPGQEAVVTAEMTWSGSGVVDSVWNVYPEGVKVISGTTFDPKADSHYTQIKMNGVDHESLWGDTGIFTTGPKTSHQLRVTANYEDPWLRDSQDKPIKRRTVGYVPLIAQNARLEVFPKPKPSFRADGLIELISVSGRVAILDSPPEWKYNFLFAVKVKGETKILYGDVDPWGLKFDSARFSDTFVALTNEDMTIVVAGDGKSATFSAANMAMGRDNINGYKIQSFALSVNVKALRIGDTQKPLQKTVVETFGANTKNYWTHRDSTQVVY